MTISHLFEDFGSISTSTQETVEEAQDDDSLAAYETGYAAGWDDASRIFEEEKLRVSADFVQNLNDISLTLQEAQASVLEKLHPLFLGLTGSVLPEVAKNTLGLLITQEITKVAAQTVKEPLELRLSPDVERLVAPWLEPFPTTYVVVNYDPSLGAGQVLLRSARGEQQIDLDGLLAAITKEVETFVFETLKGKQNG